MQRYICVSLVKKLNKIISLTKLDLKDVQNNKFLAIVKLLLSAIVRLADNIYLNE